MEELPVWLIALIFVLFVLLPIGFIWSGIKLIYKNFQFRKNAVVVFGRVVESNDLVSVSGKNATEKFTLEFEFNSPDGKTLHGETAPRSLRNSFTPHSEHEILVNFVKPGTVQIPGDRPYLKAIAMIAVGGIILFAGGGFMLSLS